MKHIIGSILILLMISVLLSSCDGITAPPQESTTETTVFSETTGNTDMVSINDHTQESKETTQTTESTSHSEQPIIHTPAPAVGYPIQNNMTESNAYLLFDHGGVIYYYDKGEGSLQSYCFDEGCDHRNWKRCISLQFVMQDVRQSVVYSPYDQRFYSLRGQKLCSFSHDGMDIRIEYSFGESGNLDQFLYDFSGAFDLQIYGRFIYMIWNDYDSGILKLMRYDIETKTMLCIYDGRPGKLERYFIYADRIYFNMSMDGKTVFGYTNYSFVNMKILWEVKNIDVASGVMYEGESYCYAETRDSVMFYAFDLESCQYRLVAVCEDLEFDEILAVTEEKIYVIRRHEETFPYRSYSCLYAIDKKSGELTLVFDGKTALASDEKPTDDYCTIKNIRFLEDNQVLLTAKFHNRTTVFLADTDENGCFTNIVSLYGS